MSLPFEYWKNTLAKLGVRVERRRVKRKSVDVGCSFETLENRLAMSIDSPIIAGFLASPTSVNLGSQVTLTATGVTDPNGDAISHVRFYRDVDNDGVLTGSDGAALGTDTDGSNGWSISTSTTGFPAGTNRYFAVAKDATDLDSDPVSATNTVLSPTRILDDGESGFSVISGTWQGPSNSGYNNDHYFSWFNNGVVEWRFANVVAGTYRVSATWTNSASNSAAAPYDILDGTNALATTLVNQKNAPAADVTAGGRNFQHLGEFEIVNGELVVRLTNTTATAMSADAIRLEHIGPAVSASEIRVYNGSSELFDAASTINLGSTFIGTEVPKTLTVKNVGVGTLNLTQLTQGVMPAGIKLVSGYASTTLAQGQTTTFTVALAATALGSAGGTLSILNNDPNEASFDIALTGVVNAVTVKDDGDSGYSIVSGTWQGPSNSGYNNDHYFSWFNNGAVEWQFTNLIPGEYRVSTTWTHASNRSASAPYLITGGDIGPVTALVNQKNAPAADATEGGRNFQHLGKVHVVNGQLVVRLTNTSATTMSADAIRLEYLPPAEIRVFDGASELADGTSTVNFGSVFYGTPKTLTVQNDGPGTLNLTQLTQAAMPAGFQLVSGLGSTALAQGQTTTFTVAIAGTTPGTVSGTLSIQSNDLDERSFDIALTGVVSTVAIKDDGDSGYSVVSGTWQGGNGGYGSDHKFSWFNNGAVEWRFANLLPATYRISATWTNSASNSATAPYDVIDGTNSLANVLVNQKNVPPADVTAGGRNFQDLGSFEIVNGELVVRLTNTSASAASADAIRLEYVGPATGVSEIRVYDASAELFDAASTVNLGSTFFGTEVPKTLTVKNVGVGTLNLTQLTQGVMPAGYRLVSGYGSTTLAQGQTTTFTVALAATSVGTAAGTLSIVNNDPNEASFDIAITGVVNAVTVKDDGDSGYSIVSGTWQGPSNSGYNNDHYFSYFNNGVVEWRFANVVPGTYRVSATWTNASNRSATAPYEVLDGTNSLALVAVNQKNAPPANVTAGGRNFQHLGQFEVVNGELVVRLTNTSATTASADAIRLEYLGPATGAPEIRVSSGSTELADGLSIIDFGATFNGTQRTLTVKNAGVGTLNLTQLTQGALPVGFELVSGFGTTTLAQGQSTAFTIALAAPSLGAVSGTLSIATNDPDETSFDIQLTAIAQTSRVIDDEDVGFSVESGTWGKATGGYNNDQYFVTTGDTGVVQWRHDNLLPGQYRVSATWVQASGRTTIAPYTVFDGGSALAIREINQKVAPTADATIGGRPFQELGVFSVHSGTLAIQLADSNPRTVSADAVRLEYVGAIPEVQFGGTGGSLVVDGAPATILDFGQSERTAKAATAVAVTNTTGTPITLTQLTQGAMPAGYALVEGLGTLSLAAGATTYFRVRLDSITPGTYSGSIAIASSVATFNLDITGEVLLTPVVVDNSEAGFQATGTGWESGAYGIGFREDLISTTGSEPNRTATWTVEGLSAIPYLVYASYRISELNTAAAPFRLYDGSVASGTLEKQTVVNQRLLPNDVTLADQGFELVGLVNLDTSTLTVELDASMIADGFVMADAIYVVPATVGSFYGFSAPSEMVTGDAVPITVGVVDPSGTLFDAINLYRDSNANGVLDVGIDALVYSDTTPSNGFNFNAGTLAVGTHRLFVAAMQDGAAVMNLPATVTSAEWWEVEFFTHRTDGERLFTTTGDLVENRKPIKLSPGQTWQDAVYRRVCGTVETTNTWVPDQFFYSFPHLEEDGTPCVTDDGSFRVNTQDVLQTIAGHSLGLPADTKMIVLEDLTGAPGNDFDYDDQYWIVQVTPYNLPVGEVIFGIEEQQFDDVLVATLDWVNGPIGTTPVAHIDWGDGTIEAGTVEVVGAAIKVKGSHSYPQEGPYGVAVMIHVPDYNYVMFAGTVAIIENVIDEESLPILDDRFIDGVTTTPLIPTLEVDYEAGTYSIFATGSGDFDFNFGHHFRGKEVLTHTRDDGEADVVLDIQGKFNVSLTPYCPCDTSPAADITTPLMTTTYSLTAEGESGFLETYDGLSNHLEKAYNLAIEGEDLTREFAHTKTAAFSPTNSTYSWHYNFSVATFTTAESGLSQNDRAYFGEVQGETREDAKNLNRRQASSGLRGEFAGTGKQAIDETWIEHGNYTTEIWDRHRTSDTPATTSTLNGTNQTEFFNEDRITDDFYESHKYADGMTGNISYSMNESTSSSSVVDRVTINQSRSSTRVGDTDAVVERVIIDPGSRIQTITSSTTSSTSFVDVQTNTPPNGLLVINSTGGEIIQNNQTRTVNLAGDHQFIQGTYTVGRTQHFTELNQARVVTRTVNDNEIRVSAQTGKVYSVNYTLAEASTGVTDIVETETNQDLTINRATTSTSGWAQTTYQTSENTFSVIQAGGATSNTTETEVNQSLSIVRNILSISTDSFIRAGISLDSVSPYAMNSGGTVSTSMHSVETNQGRVVVSDTNSTQVSSTAELGDATSLARSAIVTSSESSENTTTTTNQGTVSIVVSITERNEVSNQTANSITGANSYANSGDTAGTFTSLDTNQTRTVVSEGTNDGVFTSDGGGNAVLGVATSTNTDVTASTTTSTETNQLLTVSSTQTSTASTSTNRIGNSISGLYVLSSSEANDSESDSTETNQGRTVVSNGTSSSSTDTIGNGNSVITQSTVTNTGTSSSSMTSTETNQELTVSATQTSTGSSSSTRIGNAITGLYVLSGLETSGGESDSTETNQTRTVVSSGTNNSSTTTTGSGNSVVSESTVTNTGTSSSSMMSTETNQVLTVDATQTGTGSTSSTRTGNAITGIYTLSGTETSDGESDSTETNQTRTVVSGGTNNSSTTTTGNGNSVLSQSTVTNTGTSSSSMTSTETNQALTVSATQTNTGSSSSTRTANAVTGIYTLTGNETSDGTSNSTETNQTRTVVSSGTNNSSATTTGNGNSVLTESTIVSAGTSSSSMTSTETNQDLTVSATQTSTGSSSSTRDGNSITGIYTLTGTETSDGDSTSTETNKTRTVVSTGTNNASSTVDDNGNSVLGENTLTKTGSSSSSMTSTQTNQSLTLVATQSNSGTSTVSRVGNAILGSYTATGTETTSGDAGSTETNQTRTIVSSGTSDALTTSSDIGNTILGSFSTSLTTTGSNTSGSTALNPTKSIAQASIGETSQTRLESGNRIVGDFEGTSSYSNSMIGTINTSHQSISGTGTFSSIDIGASEFSGHSISATRESLDTSTLVRSQSEDLTNQSLVVHSDQDHTTTTTATSSANSILGDYESSVYTTATATLVVEDSNTGLVVSTTDESTEVADSTSSGNEILGDFESNSTVTRESTVTKNIDNQGILVIDSTLTSDSTTTSDSIGNQILGDSDSESTVTTNSTLVEEATNQTLVSNRTTISDVTVESTYSTNTLTGVFESTENTESEISLSQTDNNQGVALATINRSTSDSSAVTSNGNDILGDTTSTTESTSTTSASEVHTNQTRTIVQTRIDTATRTIDRTENSYTGIYDVETTGDSSFSLSQTHTNDQILAILTVSISQSGSGTLSENESGNSVVGSYTRDTETSDSDTLAELDTNQVRTVTLTKSTSSDATTTQTGSSVTGSYSLGVASSSDAFSIETNVIDPYSTITVSSVDTSTSTKLGNEISGGYTLNETNGSDSTFTERFENKTLTVNITDVSGGNGSRYETGNAVTGTSGSTSTYTGSSSLLRTESNQTLAVTIHEISESTSTTTHAGNSIVGGYLTTTDSDSESTREEESTNQTRTISLDVISNSSGTSTDNGNSITGLYTTTGDSESTATTTEHSTNKTQTIDRVDTSTSSVTTTGSGNSVLMSSSVVEITTTLGAATEADTNQSLTVTGDDTYSSTSTLDRTSNAITGLFVEVTTAESSSSLVELATNQTRTINLTKVADSTSTSTRTGNSVVGDYELSSMSTASDTTASAEYNKSLTILASQSSSITTQENSSGSDRYEDFETTITTTSNVSTGRAETNQTSVTVASRFAFGESTQVRSGNSLSGTYLETSTSSDTVTLYHVAVNQTSTDSLSQVETSTTTGTKIGNSVVGDYELTSTTALSFEIDQQDDNTSQDITGTNTGTESSTVTGSGNDITGLSSSTVTGVDTTSNNQSGTIGDRTFTLTETSSRSYTRYETGDEIIADSSTSETSTSDYTLIRSDTYTDGSDNKTLTTSGDSTTTRSGNAILGSYLQASNGDSTKDIDEAGNRGNTYSLDSTGTNTFSTTESGNSVTGVYSLTSQSTDNGLVTKTATQPLGGSFTVSHSSYQTASATTTGDYLTGDYETDGSESVLDQITQNGTATGQSFSAVSQQSNNSTEVTEGNRITGLFSGTHSFSLGTILAQSGVNAGGTYSLSLSSSETAVSIRNGNEVTGDSTAVRDGQENHILEQSNTIGADNYTLTAIGLKDYERTTTSSSITGETTQVETGTDDYTMQQTGVDGLRVYTQYLSGEDTYTITATSNDTADGLDKTITGTGTYSSLNEGTDDGVAFLESVVNATTAFGLEETGTYVDGNLVIAQTGTDRYDLLQQFNNPSTAVNGMAGTVDFSPIGAMVTVGIGVPPPTGGAGYGNGRVTVEGISSLLMGGYGSHSHANVRGSEVTGLMGLSNGWVDSSAGLSEGYAGLGHQLALEYCFAAGTKVLMADGSFKAIEMIQAGERVMAVNDRDPMGDAEPREVVRAFHNAPNELLELYLVPQDEVVGAGAARKQSASNAGGATGRTTSALAVAPSQAVSTTVIRTTLAHPFYVVGRGWIAAESLEPGDQLRTSEGGTAEVAEIRLRGTVDLVYNLEVAGLHTYFVATEDEGLVVLVHNVSGNAYGTHLPAESRGTWTEGTAGNGVFEFSDTPMNRSKGLVGTTVSFVDGYIAEGAFPVDWYFNNNVLDASVEIDAVTDGGYADFKAADEKMRAKLKDPNWKKPPGYTWNHAGKPGSTKMELVKTAEHVKVAHSGNAAVVRGGVRMLGFLDAYGTIKDILLESGAPSGLQYKVAAEKPWVFQEPDGSAFVVEKRGWMTPAAKHYIDGPQAGTSSPISSAEADNFRKEGERMYGKYIDGSLLSSPKFIPGVLVDSVPLTEESPYGGTRTIGHIDEEGPHEYDETILRQRRFSL